MIAIIYTWVGKFIKLFTKYFSIDFIYTRTLKKRILKIDVDSTLLNTSGRMIPALPVTYNFIITILVTGYTIIFVDIILP